VARRAPAGLDPSTVGVAACGIFLGLAVAGVFYGHPPGAALLMIAAVAITATALVRLLGTRTGLMVLLIASCLIDQWTFRAGSVNIRPEQIAVLIALGYFLWDRLRARDLSWIRPNVAELPLLAWFAMNLVSSVVEAPSRTGSLKILGLLLVSSIAFFLPRRLLAVDRRVFGEVVRWLLLGIAFEAGYVLATYFLHLFGPTIALGTNPATGRLEPLGTLWEPNVVGAICGAGAIAWVLLGPRYARHPWAGLALCTAASAASFSRAAWVAVLVVLLLILVTPVRRQIDRRAFGFGALIATILSAVVFTTDKIGNYSSHAGVVESVGNSTDIIGRLYQVKPVIDDLMSHKLRLLIGAGTDSYGQRHIIAGIPQHLANLELTLLNDTGILGLLLFAAFGVLLLLSAWRHRESANVVGVGGMLLVLAISNTATETLELMITWLLLGLLAAAIQMAEEISVPVSADRAPGTAA
jgi:hypothetical protein